MRNPFPTVYLITMPLEYNSHTSEPFLRLPPPHHNIILTPPRPSPEDEDALVTALNDPQVYVRFLDRPPLPFLREHAAKYIASSVEDCDRILREWDAGSGFVDGCPFRCIREETEDDDVLIGDITLFRYVFYEFPPGSEEQENAQERNMSLAAGNTDLLWGVGCKLSIVRPSTTLYHKLLHSFVAILSIVHHSLRNDMPCSLSMRPLMTDFGLYLKKYK